MSFLVRRLISTVPVLIGVVTITFLLLHFVPGDPAEIMLGEQASALDKDALRKDLGLDKPISEQYLIFWKNLVHLDLGRSLTTKRAVGSEILSRFPATAELTFT